MISIYSLLNSIILTIFNTLFNFDIGGINLLSYLIALIVLGLVLSAFINIVHNDFNYNLSRNLHHSSFKNKKSNSSKGNPKPNSHYYGSGDTGGYV